MAGFGGISFESVAVGEIHTGSIQADVAQTTFACAEMTSSQGLGTVTFDDVTNTLSWNYTYGDNPPEFDNDIVVGGGSELGSHFHGPAAAGVHAPIRVVLGAGNPNIGSAVITPAEGADLLNGLWFLLVHTTAFIDRDIRGQVLFPSAVPSYSSESLGLLLLSLLGSVTWIRWRLSAA